MGADRDLFVREEEAQAISLVRALEDSDRKGDLLPVEARRAATSEALGSGGDEGRWLAERARRLLDPLDRRLSFLPRFRRLTRPGAGLLIPVIALALLVGLATNALGPERQINVVALPLLGLILWNVASLLLLVLRRWLPLPGRLERDAPRALGLLERLTRRLVNRLPRRAVRESAEEPLRRGLERHLEDWLPITAPLAAARTRRLLHVSALALLAGAVGGMYLRGLGFEYLPAWESTFLSREAVDSLLGRLLGPAAALLGGSVPSVGDISTQRNAAPWIHLWAVTAGLFAGLPRLLLVLLESLRTMRLKRRLRVTVPEIYLRRLVASAEEAVRRVEVLPFSYLPPPRSLEGLRGLLLDHLGPKAEVRVAPSVDYGAVVPSATSSSAQLRVVLFSLSQTPEVEVHGELLSAQCRELGMQQGLVALIDAAPFRQRLGDLAEDRIEARRRSWTRVVEDAGLTPLHLDLQQSLDDAALTALVAAVWPTGTGPKEQP